MANMKTDEIMDIKNIKHLDDFLAKTQPTGSIARAITDNLYGINHEDSKSVIPESRDAYGFTFFTRPQLNLSSPNLRNLRKLSSYLTTSDKAINRYVRCMLDPKLALSGMRSALIDDEMAFIPILTNTLKSISGWPDIVMPYYDSKEGVRGERWSIADGSIDILGTFDLDCNFRNIMSEPITAMIQVWLTYMTAVFEDMASPYMSLLLENEIDYNTRIYRLITDDTKKYVRGIAACGAAFPVNDSMGRKFDYSDGTKYNDQNRDISIRFHCIGAMYNDDILVKEFNETGAMFNSDFRSLIDTGSSGNLEKIPDELRMALKNRGYPYINPNTLELEWYIKKDSATYQNIMSSYKGE